MDLGISFGETLMVVVLILVFFGSEKLPSLMRELGRLTFAMKRKANEFMMEIERSSVPDTRERPDAPHVRKKDLRKAMLARRRSQDAKDILAKSAAIRDRLNQLEQWKEAGSLFIYLSMPEEVRTDEMIELALAQGKRVAVPSIDSVSGDMESYEITGLEDLEPGPMGIRTPLPRRSRRFYKSDLDLVVCPGVAFDTQGGRLGFGKGYYDRYLRDLQGRVDIVGLAFEFQIVPDSLPISFTDIPMDLILTESRTIGSAASAD